jgi:hypothetical protein
MEALLNINAWNKFEMIFHGNMNFVDLNQFHPLLETLMKYLEWLIDPVYLPISPSRYFPNYKSQIREFPISDGGLSPANDIT